MDNKRIEQFLSSKIEAKREMSEHIDQYFAQVSQFCAHGIPTISMDDIEDIYINLMENTKKSYREMISETLNRLNDSELVRLKKESTGTTV